MFKAVSDDIFMMHSKVIVAIKLESMVKYEQNRTSSTYWLDIVVYFLCSKMGFRQQRRCVILTENCQLLITEHISDGVSHSNKIFKRNIPCSQAIFDLGLSSPRNQERVRFQAGKIEFWIYYLAGWIRRQWFKRNEQPPS